MALSSKIPINFTKLFINNKWVPAVSGKTFPTYNPATGEKLADVAEGDQADVEIAVNAAKKAFELNSPWRTMDAADRGVLLNKLADEIEKNADYLASLETLDNGKPAHVAKAADVALTVANLRYWAGWADKNHGKVIPIRGDYI